MSWFWPTVCHENVTIVMIRALHLWVDTLCKSVLEESFTANYIFSCCSRNFLSRVLLLSALEWLHFWRCSVDIQVTWRVFVKASVYSNSSNFSPKSGSCINVMRLIYAQRNAKKTKSVYQFFGNINRSFQ